MLLCPITGQVKGYPFEVALAQGLPVGGVVLSDQVKSMDWKARGARFACRVPESLVRDVLARLGPLLGA